ncbi:MAG: MFS transporter [Verrucomicrobia bacterium]|nr:MFS transporter [Verrucomicrobiota bacterium]
MKLNFPRNVWALGWTSFFTDISSEIIYPLLPVFLTKTLGASMAFVGVVEGIAESTASLLKVVSGWWSDRVAKRKPLAVAGYTLSALTRPMIALAAAGWHVLAARFVDRIGKGIRTSPRDALLADSVAPDQRGAAFGLQRSMDHAGAIVGPLIAFALLTWVTTDYRLIFWIAAVPMVFAVAALAFGAKEVAPPWRKLPACDGSQGKLEACPTFVLTPRFKRYLALLVLFTLGNSSDAFLILRAKDLGIADAMLPLLWVALHIVKMSSSLPAGALSDRIGRKTLIVGGWLVYAAVYVGFGAASAAWHIWALFIAYGFFFGMTEAAEKAMVADFYPSEQRGRAFGLYNGAIGFAALPASLLMGFLWDHFGVTVAFGTGAGLAGVAAILLALLI